MNDENLMEQTLSIDSPVPEPEGGPARLSPQDEAAVDALPPGSALLRCRLTCEDVHQASLDSTTWVVAKHHSLLAAERRLSL